MDNQRFDDSKKNGAKQIALVTPTLGLHVSISSAALLSWQK